MKLLYVIQRYGDQIVGGSESACRHFAERLVARGHEVHVLTSCAHDYVDWADEYPAGTEIINGVTTFRDLLYGEEFCGGIRNDNQLKAFVGY